MAKAKKPIRVAQRAYPEPTGGPINNGLGATSHNHSSYPQPNSANQPDPSSSAAPGVVPGAEAYRPSLAGAPPEGSVTVVNPGVTKSGSAGDSAAN